MKLKLLTMISVILLAAVFISGCVSFEYPSMHDKSFSPSERCIVLGEVSLEGTTTNVLGLFTFGGIRYTNLLAEARRKYGPVDDVVNVSVDVSWTGMSGFILLKEISMRGIAVVYTDTIPFARGVEPRTAVE